MKKVCNVIKRFTLIIYIAYFIFFNISCGLDNYIVMGDPVAQIVKKPEYDSIQFQESYFEFWTYELTPYSSGFMFLGTDIYYKIYSNSSTMISECNYLDSLSSEAETAAKAPDKLINPSSTGGYGFKQLKASNYNGSPLIPTTGSNQRVYIRLTDFQNASNYESKILVDGNNINNSTSKTQPIRNADEYTFNFGRKGTKDKKPLLEDEDVKGSSEPEDDVWYICLYAVGVGRDQTYANHYSNIVYLGAVSIDASKLDN